MLFVHGGACTNRDWAIQVAGLSDEFAVITLDTRGHGRSPVGDPRSCTVVEMATDIIRVIEHLICHG